MWNLDFVVVVVLFGMLMFDGGFREGWGRRWRLNFVHLFSEDDRVVAFILVPYLHGHSSKHLMWQKIWTHHQT